MVNLFFLSTKKLAFSKFLTNNTFIFFEKVSRASYV